MADRWMCGECGSPWAPGAPCCPRCRSTKHIEDPEAGDVTLKINRQGVVTDSAAVTPETAVLEEKLEEAQAEIAELEAKEAVPPAGQPSAPPRPRVPPRRPLPSQPAQGA